MQVFHLSHIDLDGYGCQFVAKEFFDSIQFYNANYGKEVMARLNTIFSQIDAKIAFEEKFHAKEASTFLILITDLNLTLSESKHINERVNSYKISQKDVRLLLLDHHISGEECAKAFEWYHLDHTKCATKITYETLSAMYPKKLESIKLAESKVQKPSIALPYLDQALESSLDSALDSSLESASKSAPESACHASLEVLSEMINSVDIWKEEGYGFEFGKVALGVIAASSELNRFMFDREHREYKFFLLEQARWYLTRKKGAVLFDNAVFLLKKQALKGDAQNETMDFITSRIQANLLGAQKEQCLITYRDKRGFLSYSMGGISVLANLFLRQNPEVDFYMDINHRGNVSLRANGNCDVCALSQEVFNGGGHKNAAGGKMEGFRESFFYEDIKAQVQNMINTKTQSA
ncbi:phosphoesterase [Helicobacter sp. CLO-3]|uniref:DHH family phosphoesterase n=1 Tax=unclassified Helicobacter TaxID=2593540 RepID=UPI000805025A|nr:MULTISPECIES: phosphoesterase [unclassified Helicobacter]OBV28346.1 phosphoesterase [Helicobacter sp. CLO-3]OHU84515.1 phosphoesterase [Helicobacter sp. CLO-3]